MRRFLMTALAMASAVPAAAQQIDADGSITAPGVRIDRDGIRTTGTRVDAGGVHATGHAGTIVIRTNNNARTIDCRGQSLSVQGNRNQLTARNCRRIEVMGNHNQIRARFATPSSVMVPGNDNVVSWSAAPRVRVGVSAPGSRNAVRRSS